MTNDRSFRVKPPKRKVEDQLPIVMQGGTPGTPGSVWRNGSGVPSNSLGINGDYYVNDDNGDVYRKVSGAYVFEFNISGNSPVPLLYSAENKSGGTLARGQPVATHSTGTGFVAALGAGLSRPAVGLLYEDTLNTVAGRVQKDGMFVLADWTPITGATTLVRGPYYLHPTTSGKLTSTAPTTAGQLVQPIGYAVATDTLEVEIQSSILL